VDVDHIIEIDSKKEMLDLSNIDVKLGNTSLRKTDKELEIMFRKEMEEHHHIKVENNFEGKYNSAESKREEDNKKLLNIDIELVEMENQSFSDNGRRDPLSVSHQYAVKQVINGKGKTFNNRD
jgi:hypothetical protein